MGTSDATAAVVVSSATNVVVGRKVVPVEVDVDVEVEVDVDVEVEVEVEVELEIAKRWPGTSLQQDISSLEQGSRARHCCLLGSHGSMLKVLSRAQFCLSNVVQKLLTVKPS